MQAQGTSQTSCSVKSILGLPLFFSNKCVKNKLHSSEDTQHSVGPGGERPSGFSSVMVSFLKANKRGLVGIAHRCTNFSFEQNVVQPNPNVSASILDLNPEMLDDHCVSMKEPTKVVRAHRLTANQQETEREGREEKRERRESSQSIKWS